MPAKQITLIRTFQFESAHRLPNLPAEHKCSRLHGHSFSIELAVTGPIGAETGWYVDYADIKAAWRPMHEALDHRYLNEIGGLENPTSELLAVWIWDRLVDTLPGLESVTVAETCTARAVYRGG